MNSISIMKTTVIQAPTEFRNIKEYVNLKKAHYKELISEMEHKPKLVIIQLGHVPASDRYVRNKIKDFAEVGLPCELVNFEDTTTESYLLDYLSELNKNPEVTGYLVQLPLPSHISEEKIKLAIDPKKDVDGFHPLSKTVPATALGIYNYLHDMNYRFEGRNAVVIGRSNLVGRPVATLLLNQSMNVTVIHSKTMEADKRMFIKEANLIVVATGHRNTLTSDFSFRKDAVIIDVGINVNEDGSLCGDCEPDLPVAYQSPVPGGVGLLTRLTVIHNLLALQNA